MSFPTIIYRQYGREKESSTTKIGGLALGTLMRLPDGSIFEHCRAGSVAVVAGKLYEGPAATADHGCGTADNLIATAGALGATTVTLRMGGTTAVVKDHYVGGYLGIRDDTGEAYKYRIKSNNSAAAGSVNTFTVTLEPRDTLVVAVAANSTTAALRKHPCDGVLLKTANTVSIGSGLGVAAASCAASAYFWRQRTGLASVLVDGTVIIGRPVVASSAIAGAVAAAPADTSTITNAGRLQIVGEVHMVSPDTEYGLIDLRL